MSAAPIFRDFAQTVLAHRGEDGIRGIDSERNRNSLHIETSDFASKPLDEITSVDVRDWLRVMSHKKAADTRGDRKITTKHWLYELPRFAPENPLGLVFPYAHGARRGVGKPLGRGGELKAHLARIGIARRVRWHDLRHTCASSLVAGWWGRRWSLEEVQIIMGHSSILITQRYAHLGEQELAKAGQETTFAHAAMPPVDAAPDTQRDVSVWFDDEAACA